MQLRLALPFALIAFPLAAAAGDESDYIRRQLPGAGGALPYQPEFQFLFGSPARWPGHVFHWRYNHAGAPSAPSPFVDASTTVAALNAAASKWSAVCGIQFVYDGPTTTLPYNGIDPLPDGIPVVGWRELSQGTLGITYAWSAEPPNEDVLVDADIVFSPGRFSAPPPSSTGQMERTAAHEWGHAIGIKHSNLSGALMSGSPDTPYSSVSDPQADDIRACRCLYGAAAGQSAAYACSLPSVVNFGLQTVGATSTAKRITFTNDFGATAPLAVIGTTIAGGEFLVTGTTCAPATPLTPGASCTIDLVARPAIAGTRNAEAVIATSDGPYRLPLVADGYAPPVPPPTYNVQGIWWNSPAGSESGWGLNLAHQGDTVFASWFTYDASGRGSWFVMTARKNGTNSYAGTLYQTRGPAFNAQPWNSASVVNTSVGDGTLTFNDASHGTFTYTVGGGVRTKLITRQAFGPLPVCAWGGQSNLALATNYQDLWWAAPGGSESGWGINLNHQGDTIFATWFTYDLDGTPLWLVVTAPKTAPGTYGGDLYRTTGPAFGATPFDPAKVEPIKVGTASFTFADGNAATFDYSVQLPGMLAPAVQSKPITRQIFAAPGTACR